MILKLTCEEGFSYVGWQRVVAEFIRYANGYDVKHNVSGAIAELINAKMKVEGLDGREPLRISDGCFFILSGESFTLNDVVTLVDDLFMVETRYQDGDKE